MNPVFLAILMLFLMAGWSSAGEPIQMSIPGKGITFTLPADWQRIPTHILEEHQNAVARASANPARVKGVNLVFAAQRKANDYAVAPISVCTMSSAFKETATTRFHLRPSKTTYTTGIRAAQARLRDEASETVSNVFLARLLVAPVKLRLWLNS
jgi:hypothetical protein